MRRSGFRRKVYDPSNPPTVKPRKPLARVSKKKVKKVKVAGHPTVKDTKQDIQDTARECVIIRDKKCILYGQRCYHEYGVSEGIVWQAEHLVERSNSATYADLRLIVLVCKNCHGWKHFTKSNHDQYDEWVKQKLSKERVAHWEKCVADKWRPTRTGAYDWKLSLVALKQELKTLKENATTTNVL